MKKVLLQRVSTLYSRAKTVKRPPFADAISNIWLTIKVAIVAILLINFYRTFDKKPYTILPFNVPDEWIKNGHRGDIAVEQVLIEMTNLINFVDSSTSRASAFRQLNNAQPLAFQRNINEGKEPNGFEIDAWFKVGRKLLNKSEKTISGNVVKDSLGGYKFILLIDGIAEIPFLSHNPDSIYRWAAIHILEKTEPYQAVNYYLKKSDLAKVAMLLENVKDTTTDDYKRSRLNLRIAKIRQDNTPKSEQNLKDFINIMASMNTLCSTQKDKLGAYVHYFGTLVALINWLSYNELAGKAFQKDRVALHEQFKVWHKDYEKNEAIEGRLNTEAYDIEKTKSYIEMSMGYLFRYFEPKNEAKIDKHYAKALTLNPYDVFILNSLAYHHLDKYMDMNKYVDKVDSIQKEWEELTLSYLNKALRARPQDGNIYDSYAECLISFGDTCKAFMYLDSALMYPKTIDNITLDAYTYGSRFIPLCDAFPDDFALLLDRTQTKKTFSCQVKNSTIMPKNEKKEVKSVSKTRKSQPLSTALTNKKSKHRAVPKPMQTPITTSDANLGEEQIRPKSPKPQGPY